MGVHLGDFELEIKIEVDSEDEVRAVLAALKRAAASERAEINRLSGLRATQYGDEDTYQSQIWRAKARERMLDRMTANLASSMQVARVRPWD